MVHAAGIKFGQMASGDHSQELDVEVREKGVGGWEGSR